MGYSEWFKQHAQKHKNIVEKLRKRNLSKEQIVEYFDFESMKKEEEDFCPLYAKDKKCHNIDSLNCYMCACPNFRFDDDGVKKLEDKTLFSFCAINSKDGKAGVYGVKIHQNCSLCSVPHTKEYVLEHFEYEWTKMMQKCKL